MDEHEVAGRDGPTRRDVDGLDARTRCAPCAPSRPSTATTSPSRPSSEHVMQTSASPRRASASAPQQAGVLEADVGQLPQQVVPEHERAVVGAADAGRRRPTARGRPRRRRGRSPGPDPDRRRSPRRRPAGTTSAHGGSSAAADGDHDVAGARRARAARRRRRRPSTVTAGSAGLPTITGWTNSTATWRACSRHSGATHHSVAPAAKRRASAKAASASRVGGVRLRLLVELVRRSTPSSPPRDGP